MSPSRGLRVPADPTPPGAARPRRLGQPFLAEHSSDPSQRGGTGAPGDRLVDAWCRACGPMKKAPTANQRAAQADDPLALLHHHLLTARLRKTCQDEMYSVAFLDPFFSEYARLTVHPQPNSRREQVLCLGRG